MTATKLVYVLEYVRSMIKTKMHIHNLLATNYQRTKYHYYE